MIRTSIVAGLLVLSAAGSVASQQVDTSQQSTTRLIPFSGVLAGASAADTVDGARTVTFALFDEADGGTLLWSETQIVNVDGRGRYAAHLGTVTALPLEIFRTEQARWLEVSIDGKALPRTMLVAVPYALRAADAETLGGKPLSDFVLADGNGRRVRPDGTHVDEPAVDGTGVPNQIAKWSTDTTLSSSIITESFDNRVGVLAPDPTGGGVVDSRVTIRNLDNNTAFGVLNLLNQRRFALNTNSNGSWTVFDGGTSTWNQGLTQLNGRVGLGTLNPSGRLHVVVTTGLTGTIVQSNSNGLLAIAGGGGRGIEGQGSAGSGIIGFSNTDSAIVGQALGAGLAGEFNGNVDVSGTLTKGGGAFRIDHPLDPANKYLSHSFVESPDMMNVYNGNAVLDAKGEAWVRLPDWFEALNRDFRYQLTAIGAPGPNLHIASKVSDNRFKIAGGVPGGEVSWLVTGVRHDAWAKANRIPVEHDKPQRDRGFYLHPKAFDLPAALTVPSRRIEPTPAPRQ